MAKVMYSPQVGDMRNKTGGAVHTKTRSGSMIRRKVSPTQPHTPDQMAVRANFTALAKSWSSDLSDAQRAGWNALAKNYPQKDVFGNSYTLTGLQLYISINRNLQTIGESAISDAPTDLSVDGIESLTLDTTTPTVITCSDCQTTAGETIYTYTSFTGTGPVAGMEVVVTGFATPGNNGTFTILSTTGGASGTFTVATTTQSDETHAGTATGAGMSVAFTPTPLAAGMHLVLAASRQMSAGRSTSFGGATTIKTLAAAATSPQSILTEYQTKYGTLTSGRKIQVSAYIINETNGAASLRMTAQDTVA